MKRILCAAASVAALTLTAGAASAQDGAQNAAVAVTATVNAKCGVTARANTVEVAGDLTGTDAKVRSGVTTEIANALNTAQIVAFCNGVSNSVTIERSVLARTGATGNSTTEGGFAQFINYHLDATMNGMALDTTSAAGASNVAQRFGGHTSLSDSRTHVRFAQASTNGAAVAASGGSNATALNWNAATDRRLAAGTYTGSVNVIVAPGT